MEKLQQVLKNENENENYLFPFFWQHGESKEILEEYMEQINGCGMKATCIEARPHPDFAGEKWWKDLDIIIKKAKEQDMKLWILDDAHFPTGYANGAIRDHYPQFKKWYLDMRRFDLAGPIESAKINMKFLKGRPWERPADQKDEPIIGIYAAKRATNRTVDKDPILSETLVDITKYYTDGILTFDIPKGNWSVFVVFATRKGGEETTSDYLNPLVKEATNVLLESVYEPHYLHYKEEFGKTIVGFFSDEPRFGNKKGTDASIGRVEMVLPWRLGLEEELGFHKKYLPLLFVPAYEAEVEIRFQYMDKITTLYQQNFTKVLADWCHAHNVLYLGHNIEDNGAHARLGYGTGHYFRGQEDQDLSGIDVIGGQLVPGQPYHHDAFSTGGSDGEFYHYALAKLGSSFAHLDEKKKGRAMCEAYGAYGWNEGLKLMKWITDHLIVRGINYIVPHAFNPKEFPDWDCPPHFYAHGNNPQFRYFHVFSNYTNRLLTLFNDGIHHAPVAVLYPAETEWMGEYMPVEAVIRELSEVQIDCDILSMDYLEKAKVEDHGLCIAKEKFELLIVPYGEYIPVKTLQTLVKFAKEGLKVLFTDAYPKSSIPENKPLLEEMKQLGSVAARIELAKACDKVREVELESAFLDIVYYHYEQGDIDYYMFFNESVSEEYIGRVKLPDHAYYYAYDAFVNELYETDLNLHLVPYESTVLLGSAKELPAKKRQSVKNMEVEIQDLNFEVSFCEANDYPNFEKIGEIRECKDIRQIPGMDQKTGTVRYETTLKKVNAHKQVILELEHAWEVAEVFLNGKSAGVRIAPPYRYDVTELLSEEVNELAIEVTNTLGNQLRDGISQYLVIEPFGITGNIKLYKF